MFDVITFGSSAWDVFMELPPKYIKKDAGLISGKGFEFNMGSKIDIPGMRFAFGGGGVNTATTFARQGFNTAHCGMVGDDIPGREVAEHLKRLGIDTTLLYRTPEKATNNSVVLNARGADRVIMVYRGASELLDHSRIGWDKLDAKLYYLAPLSGRLCRLTEQITAHAKRSGATVAANLGNSQLAMGRSCIKSLLARIDVLILNREEAALLTGVDYENEKKIITETARLHLGINIITKGKEGAVITARGMMYSGKTGACKIVDVTGAGDAFGSGFMSGMLASDNDIEYSMKLALVNAKHCLSVKGADKLMSKEDNYLVDRENIKIKKTRLK
jgi:sugar/nucleoside kinase (ribokinase family)